MPLIDSCARAREDSEDFVLSRAGGFQLDRLIEKDNIMKLVSNSFSSEGRNTPLLLLAASGMGKSTLLAQAVGSMRKGRQYDVLHSVFVGSVERSSDALAVGRALCVALSRDLAAAAESGVPAAEPRDPPDLPTDLQGICETLEWYLCALSELDRKVILLRVRAGQAEAQVMLRAPVARCTECRAD